MEHVYSCRKNFAEKKSVMKLEFGKTVSEKVCCFINKEVFCKVSNLYLLNLLNNSHLSNSARRTTPTESRFYLYMCKSTEICDETLNVVLKIFFRAHLRGQVFLVVCSIYEAFHVNCPSARRANPKSCYF